MGKKIIIVLSLALLAACSGGRKTDDLGLALDNPRNGAGIGAPLDYALPGVPLRNELQADLPGAPAAEKAPAAQAAAPAEAKPEAAAPTEAKPAAVLVSNKDLDFHLAAAARYSGKKYYRSAAAEYGAAVKFLPPGDAREVFVLERQGAMQLKAGKALKAEEFFRSAIARAGKLNTSGEDLANAYLGLGYCQEIAKKIPGAISSYEKALEFTGNATIKARLADTISSLKKAP